MKVRSILVALSVAVAASAGVMTVQTKASAEDLPSVEQITEYRYYDAPSMSLYSAAESETISYTKKEEKKIPVSGEVPTYTSLSYLTNSCGAVAGTMVVGFYDKYYENLIPDYVTYTPSTGKYKRQDTVKIPEVMNELYTLMKTNVVDVGVSQSECLDGLKAYVENRSLNIQYSSIKKSSKFDYATYQASINADRPVLLFCDKLPVKTFWEGNNQDKIATQTIPGFHVAVGYGHYTVKYYNGSNNFRTDTYLMVATGKSTPKTGYVQISSTSWLVDGYSVVIS